MSDLNDISNQFFDLSDAARPTAWTWAKHLTLLLLAFVTVTVAGTLQPFGFIPIFPNENPQTAVEIFRFLIFLPYLYLQFIYETVLRLAGNPEELKYGLKFSVSLLTILTAHEAGHYIACRIYGVKATLPYFIPAPPLIGPAGTLGAFIKILSPLPSSRATFDIGVAGPIAGFLALIPVAVIGLATMQQITPEEAANYPVELIFSDPLAIKFLAYLFNIDLNLAVANPFYAATWIGLLVTSLNLIPSGQLDGGHAIYALFGENIHKWMGRIAFVIMSTISILGWLVYNSPSGFLFTILLAVMLRIRHPEPWDVSPLDFKRKIIAFLTLLIFVLSFVPFPIQIK